MKHAPHDAVKTIAAEAAAPNANCVKVLFRLVLRRNFKGKLFDM